MARSLDYDSIAADYDRRYAGRPHTGIRRALRALVRPGMRVLEVGCGTGRWLEYLESLEVRAAGIDPSTQMLSRARSRNLAASLVRGRAERLPWPAATFDRLVCINALHHFSERSAFLTEARRVLAATGEIAIYGLNPLEDPGTWFVHRFWPETLAFDRGRYVAATRLREELVAAGFRAASSRVVEEFDEQIDRRTAERDGWLARSATSQLAMIADDLYRAGLRRARAALAAGERLRLRINIHGTTAAVDDGE